MRLALLVVIVAGLAAFFIFGADRQMTIAAVVEHKDALVTWAEAHPLAAPLAYIASYQLLGLFGLPGSSVLNVSAGLLFGLVEGLLLVLLASTLASSVAFVSFRYLFHRPVQAYVHRRFPQLERGLARESVYFAFVMRLVPVVPYSATNLILAVSPIPFGTYLWVTALALLPRYVLYVYAGTQIGDVQDLDDLLSPPLLVALTLLALLPWAARRLLAKFRPEHDRPR